jgi:putative tricarboxylic transport membrane protein
MTDGGEPPMKSFANGDVVSGGVLAGLGVFVVIEARHWDYLAPDGPGPGFFPLWYGLALIVLSLVLTIGALRRRAAGTSQRIAWGEVGRALAAWIALTVSIALLKLLGFVVSFALLTFVIVSVMYRRPLAFGLAAGVASAAAFYAIFPLALNVELPVGLFGF